MDAIAPLPNSIFRMLAHFAPDALLVVDEDGRVVFANAQVERLFGYEREELLGSSMEILLPERLRGVHAGHRASFWREPSPRAMGTRMTLLARRRDGQEFPVEVSLSPIYTDDGMYVAAAVRDVSERRSMEEALRASEERYRLLAEHAEDVVYRISLNGEPQLEYVSPSVEALTGQKPAEFYADAGLLREITHPDDRTLLDRWLADPDEVAAPVVFRAVRPDGAIVWHEQRFGTVRDDDGRVIAIEGIARDVTEQRRIEEERRLLLAETEIERERERIGADLHDGVMQTMYSVGLQLSSYVRRSKDLTDEMRAGIEEAIEQLNSAIGDIRRYVLDLRPVDFTGDFGESVESLQRLFAASTGIEVTYDADGSLPALHEEAAMELFLLTREALSNVRRHADASSVAVRLAAVDGHLELRLEDDGVGFDAASMPRDEQFGLRNMETRARIIGGALTIESAPGEGTALLLKVPLERVTDGVTGANESGAVPA